MSTTQPIFLNNSDDIVVLFGKEFTAQELKDAVIDSAILRKSTKR